MYIKARMSLYSQLGYNSLLIMADYQSTAIWNGGNLEYKQFPISHKLRKRCDRWIRYYNYNCQDYLAKKDRTKKFNMTWFVKEGCYIANQFKRELPHFTILYFNEETKSSLEIK
jgi:hypothetical protein